MNLAWIWPVHNARWLSSLDAQLIRQGSWVSFGCVWQQIHQQIYVIYEGSPSGSTTLTLSCARLDSSQNSTTSSIQCTESSLSSPCSTTMLPKNPDPIPFWICPLFMPFLVFIIFPSFNHFSANWMADSIQSCKWHRDGGCWSWHLWHVSGPWCNQEVVPARPPLHQEAAFW